MPLVSRAPESYTVDYVEGEYALKQTDPEYPNPLTVEIPGSYGNATLAVDARLAEPTTDRLLLVGCRDDESNGTSGYVGLFDPNTGEAALGKIVARRIARLTDLEPADGFELGDAMNHIELTCTGDQITMSINGIEAASANDSTYTDGSLWLGAVALSFENLEARFGQLVVTQR